LELLLLIRRLLVVLIPAAFLSACTGFFFYPWEQHVRTPAHIGLAYDDVWFETEDGVRLHGWFLPASGRACGTILFLHGNAENVSTHIGNVYWLPSRGFNVFLLDYRGYGASAGKPSLPGLQRDIEAAMRHLLDRPSIDDSAIVVFGQSLGGAAAIYYVAHTEHRSHIRALVAESALASHRDIAREKLAGFWLTWPFQWLAWLTISNAYSPVAVVGRVAPVPLLLIHGEEDRIIPLAHGERLYAAGRAPKEFWIIENAGHIAAFRSERLRERLVSYLYRHTCPHLPVPARSE